MNLMLLLAIIFLFTFFFGILLERIKIPWFFAALILGLIFAFKNPYQNLTSSETFNFLSWLGMFFLLFWIGFELDLGKIKKIGKFILKSTFFIILFEAFFGSLLVHFIFGYAWFISILVALSFATVGEGVLIPVLDEFKLTKTKLGQTILGIGILDDIIEIFVIILAVASVPVLVSSQNLNFKEVIIPLLLFFALFLLALGVISFERRVSHLKIRGVEIGLPLILATFFLLAGFGSFAHASALGALLAGIATKRSLPEKRILILEPKIRALTYGFLGPIFFFWVGKDTEVRYLISSPGLIFLVFVIIFGAKILASFLVAKGELGKKPSIFMGIALGVRFSTSLVIIKFLFENSLIGNHLYSILIGITVASVIIPFLLSFLKQRWETSLKPHLSSTF